MVEGCTDQRARERRGPLGSSGFLMVVAPGWAECGPPEEKEWVCFQREWGFRREGSGFPS